MGKYDKGFSLVPRRCHGVMVSWCHGVMVSWCHGGMVSWCHGEWRIFCCKDQPKTACFAYFYLHYFNNNYFIQSFIHPTIKLNQIKKYELNLKQIKIWVPPINSKAPPLAPMTPLIMVSGRTQFYIIKQNYVKL